MISRDQPLVFLDFDAVLNHAGLALVHGRASRKFDRLCCELIVKLCQVTDARIIISSSWREGLTILDLHRIIEVQGNCHVPEDLVIDKTPAVMGTRGAQIEAWRETNGHIGPYVVLDDIDDFAPTQKPHVVITSPLRGFGFVEFLAALMILDPASPLLRQLHQQLEGAQRSGVDWSVT